SVSFKAASAVSSLSVVSVAPLINVRFWSNASRVLKLLPLVLGFAPLGPFQFSTNRFARVVGAAAIASGRELAPIVKRLVPAREIFIGSATLPFNELVLSAMRPPQPVWPTVLATDVCC